MVHYLSGCVMHADVEMEDADLPATAAQVQRIRAAFLNVLRPINVDGGFGIELIADKLREAAGGSRLSNATLMQVGCTCVCMCTWMCGCSMQTS